MVVGSMWDAKKREKQSGNQIAIGIPFCDDLGIILGGILGAKIVQQSMRILSAFSEGPLGTAPPGGGGGVWPMTKRQAVCFVHIRGKRVVSLRRRAFAQSGFHVSPP